MPSIIPKGYEAKMYYDKPNKIQLTRQEIEVAAQAGITSYLNAVYRNNSKPNNSGNSTIQSAICGYAAEAAVARALDIPWDGHLNDMAGYDVGKFQIKTTNCPWGDLVLQENDLKYGKSTDIYILVVNNMSRQRFTFNQIPTFWIIGFASLDRVKAEGVPAYTDKQLKLTQEQLLDINEITFPKSVEVDK